MVGAWCIFLVAMQRTIPSSLYGINGMVLLILLLLLLLDLFVQVIQVDPTLHFFFQLLLQCFLFLHQFT